MTLLLFADHHPLIALAALWVLATAARDLGRAIARGRGEDDDDG
jgi:hypothetical protein